MDKIIGLFFFYGSYKMLARLPFISIIFVHLIRIHFLFAAQVDVSILDVDTGFFMKPFNPPKRSTTSQEWAFVAVPGAHMLKATYGPYEDREEVSPLVLHKAINNQSSVLNFHAVDGYAVTGHFVSDSVTSEKPVLQVLFHASRLDNHTGFGSSRSKAGTPKLCLEVFAFKDNEAFTSSCTITDSNSVCLAEMTLPDRWWQDKYAQTVDVLYSVFGAEQMLRCFPESSPYRLERNPNRGDRRTFLGTVTLTHGQMSYQELKEDQQILIYVPQDSFYSGSKFKVPVKLQVNSDLEIFVIKVKVKSGIHIAGAEGRNGSQWKINLDVGNRRQSGMVTAYIGNKELYSRVGRIQEIYDWVFEVDSGRTEKGPVRLSFSLEYEMTIKQHETYGLIENKVGARIQIQDDDIRAIVPVVKTTEFVNLATLNGVVQSYPIFVYSILHNGQIQDVTSQSTCHSADETVLQVTESCNVVYVSGRESKGSSSVGVMAKYGRHTRSLFMRIWIPEFPLDVELSDNKLSQVSGWRVPLIGATPLSSRIVDEKNPPNKAVTPDSNAARKLDGSLSCQMRFQSSSVDIYTRFVTSDSTHSSYMLHRKAQFRITEHVRSQIRIADQTVAQLRGNVIDGIKPGRTEVQVVSRFGNVIGAKEIKVASDRVGIEKLDVLVTSGIDLSVDAKMDFPGAISARVSRNTQLNRKFQEALLDVVIEYDDDTSIPLHLIPRDDYVLTTEVLDEKVVKLSPSSLSDSPKLVAVSTGSGELVSVVFGSSRFCPVTKSRPLATDHAHVDIDITDDLTQNDASHFGYRSKDIIELDDGYKIDKALSENKKGKTKNGKMSKATESQFDSGVAAPVDNPIFQADESEKKEETPRLEAQKQPLSRMQGTTSLELTMYILLAIFCFAVIVFTTNCMLFIARRSRKHKITELKNPVSEVQDWVWIDRKTLERNSVNTVCSKTLMPEADFNGNHDSGSSSSSSRLSVPPANGTKSRYSNGSSGFVSTYKGSECSIRITANLLPDDNGNTLEDATDHPLTHSPMPNRQPQSLRECCEKSAAEKDDTDVEMAESDIDHGTVSICQPETSLLKSSKYVLSREERLRQLEEAVASGSEVDWDYDELGMTYEELMEYFDNMKESTA